MLCGLGFRRRRRLCSLVFVVRRSRCSGALILRVHNRFCTSGLLAARP